MAACDCCPSGLGVREFPPRTLVNLICDGVPTWFDIETGDEIEDPCIPPPDETNMAVSGAGPFDWDAVVVAPANLSFYNYGALVTQWEGQYSSAGPPASWRINTPEIGGDLDPDGFAPPLLANQPAGYVGTKTQNGVTITLETLAGNLLPNFALNRWGSFGGANAAHMRVTFSVPVTFSFIGGPDFGDGINEGMTNVQAVTVPPCP